MGLGQFANVATSTELIVLAIHHDSPDARVRLGCLDYTGHQLCAHFGREAVNGWVIDRNGRHLSGHVPPIYDCDISRPSSCRSRSGIGPLTWLVLITT